MVDDNPAAARAAATQPDEAAVTRHLRRLGTAYPGFTFNYAPLGRKGRRWTAERRDRAGGGLMVMITDDLLELHAALQRDKACRRQREQAMREDSGEQSAS